MGHLGGIVPGVGPQQTESVLLIFPCKVKGFETPLNLLIDSGASHNFVRRKTLELSELNKSQIETMERPLAVRLANGQVVSTESQIVQLEIQFEEFESKTQFHVMEMDERYDIILGMKWLISHEPSIDWRGKTIHRTVPLGSKRPVEWHSVENTYVDIPETLCTNVTRDDVLKERDSNPKRDCESLKDYTQKYMRKDTLKCVGAHSGVEDTLPKREMKSRDDDPKKRQVRFREPLEEAEVLANSHSHRELETDEQVNDIDLPLSLPKEGKEVMQLKELKWNDFLDELKESQIVEIAVLTAFDSECNSSSNADESVLDTDREKRYKQQGWESLKDHPAYSLLCEYKDVFPDEIPPGKPLSKGVEHAIDLEPGSTYCVTRQWPLPKDQVDYIDDFFQKKHEAGLVRESISPYSSPTFCVKKATGGWRIVHAYNKLNAATIPAQTPIPRKDVLIDSMGGSTIFTTIDLRDGFYQILTREADVPKTAVSTPSGMLWEWLVMPQGLKNAPATFNRLVQNAMRKHRSYAPAYFDDIYIHSSPSKDQTAIEIHLNHLRKVFDTMREYKLYSNLKKCIFCVEEIPVLGCYVGVHGVRADPEKVEAITKWQEPKDVKTLRKFLGLATYLHRYAENYAQIARPLSDLLKKDNQWDWSEECQLAFNEIKASLVKAPILALPDYSRSFSVVCDASDYAIGCALMQKDLEGQQRVISYQSRLLKPAERNYPVHDKELLSIKYALMKFRVHLLGGKPFVVYTDHASLRIAVNTPHLSQRMARWLSFFAEYDFKVEYKPGKDNILADALSRPDLEVAVIHARRDVPNDTEYQLSVVTVSEVSNTLKEELAEAYKEDDVCKRLIAFLSEGDATALTESLSSRVARFSYDEGLLYHKVSEYDYPRIVVPNDTDLRIRIMDEFHETPYAGHLGREKTFLNVAAHYWWPHLIKWITTYVRSCESCQRVKVAPSVQAPLKPMPIPLECWNTVSLDFVFGLPPDVNGNTGVVVFVCSVSKQVHIAPCKETVTAEQSAKLFLQHVFRYHGMPKRLVSDRDPRFTSHFWKELFCLLGTDLAMSTAAHPETDGQTERVNRVVEDILRSLCDEDPKGWSNLLVFVEFAINNSTHSSTGLTPFFANGLRHPHVPVTLMKSCRSETRFGVGGSELSQFTRELELNTSQSDEVTESKDTTKVVETAALSTNDILQASPRGREETVNKKQEDRKTIQAKKLATKFLSERAFVIAIARDKICKSQERQKLYADRRGRKHKDTFEVGDKVLLSTSNIPKESITNVGSTKLLPRRIGPFTIIKKVSDQSYKLDIPSSMRMHPTFYVGHLRRYLDPHQDLFETLAQEHPLTLPRYRGKHPQVLKPFPLRKQATQSPSSSHVSQSFSQDSHRQESIVDQRLPQEQEFVIDSPRDLSQHALSEQTSFHPKSLAQQAHPSSRKKQWNPNDEEHRLKRKKSLTSSQKKQNPNRIALTLSQKARHETYEGQRPPVQYHESQNGSQLHQIQTQKSVESFSTHHEMIENDQNGETNHVPNVECRQKNPLNGQAFQRKDRGDSSKHVHIHRNSYQGSKNIKKGRTRPHPLKDNHGNTRWQIESLGRSRQTPQGEQIRVKWKGYPSAYDSWEPRMILEEDVPLLLRKAGYIPKGAQ